MTNGNFYVILILYAEFVTNSEEVGGVITCDVQGTLPIEIVGLTLVNVHYKNVCFVDLVRSNLLEAQPKLTAMTTCYSLVERVWLPSQWKKSFA